MKIKLNHLLAALALVFAASFATGFIQLGKKQAQADHPSLFDKFAQEEIVEIAVRTDLGLLLRDKEGTPQPATVSWNNGEESFQIQLSARGKTRLDICEFPPLKLNFRKGDLKRRGLAPYDKIKLITHCIDDQNLVLREYLVYQLYSLMTDKSFRTQLARVRYLDTQGKVADMERYAVILENTDEMADRVGGEIVEADGEELQSVDASQYQMLTIFQYMIGNTDWNLSKRHNVKLVQLLGGGAPVPVPYDFDFAGMVNAPYAKPHPQLPIQEVTQRFFQWRGKSTDGLEKTIGLFKAKQHRLIGFCQGFQLLDQKDRREVAEFLKAFFDVVQRADSTGESIVVVLNGKEEIS
jgi:hypothetical protein